MCTKRNSIFNNVHLATGTFLKNPNNFESGFATSKLVFNLGKLHPLLGFFRNVSMCFKCDDRLFWHSLFRWSCDIPLFLNLPNNRAREGKVPPDDAILFLFPWVWPPRWIKDRSHFIIIIDFASIVKTMLSEAKQNRHYKNTSKKQKLSLKNSWF